MTNSKINKKEQIDIEQTAKDLVFSRIQGTSSNLKLHIGETTYTREEILKGIKSGNEIGKKIVEDQLAYLRAISSGQIYKLLQ